MLYDDIKFLYNVEVKLFKKQLLCHEKRREIPEPCTGPPANRAGSKEWSGRYASVRHTWPDVLRQTALGRGTEHGYDQMAVGTAAIFSAAAFGGILLLYNEEPDEAHSA